MNHRRIRRKAERSLWKKAPKMELAPPSLGQWIETEQGPRIVAYVDHKTRQLITYKPAWHQTLRRKVAAWLTKLKALLT